MSEGYQSPKAGLDLLDLQGPVVENLTVHSANGGFCLFGTGESDESESLLDLSESFWPEGPQEDRLGIDQSLDR